MLTSDDLESETERLVCERVGAGEWVDASVLPQEGRVARAELIAEVVTSDRGPDGRRPRALRLRGARVTGRLDLDAATLVCPLALEGCSFDRPLVLDEAWAPSVRICGCELSELRARQLKTRGDLALDRVKGTQLLLTGAVIGGLLSLKSAALRNPHGPVLDGDMLEVGQGVEAFGLRTEGELRLLGAHIRGQLQFIGARLSNADGPALNAAGLHVEQDVFCREGFSADGGVSLVGARIGGQLELIDARLTNVHGPALDAEGLEVDQGVYCAHEFVAHGGVNLTGAHIRGELGLRGARLARPDGLALNAAGLRVEQGMFAVSGFVAQGEVRLSGARIGGFFDLSGARLSNPGGRALDADRLQAEAHVLCQRGFRAEGEMRLQEAHIGGQLAFAEAKLANRGGPAVSADGVRVEQGVFCSDGFTAVGAIRMVNARIGGPLEFNGAELADSDGPALLADGLHVAASALLKEGFVAHGGVRFVGAHIDGDLSLNGATLVNPDDTALVADRLLVDGDVFCRDFTAHGAVDVPEAHIRGVLELIRARLSNPGAWALDAEGLRVDRGVVAGAGVVAQGDIRLRTAKIEGLLDLGALSLEDPSGGRPTLDLGSVAAAELRLPATPGGAVLDLTGARVGQLHDPVWRAPAADVSAERPYRPRLTGLVYETLGPESDNLAARLDWVSQAREGYLPHAYDQLEGVLRAAGREEDAREVAIAKLRARRTQLRRPARWWSIFLDWTVGYGYRPWRALYALVSVITIGWGVFTWASWEHLRPLKPADQLPQFAPWLYSIDSVLPVINLGQEGAWAATGAAQYWYAFSVLVGWVLGTALIAAVTAVLTRD